VDSPLKNPAVVGGLALGAVCFMLYKFVPSDWLEKLEGPSKPLLPPPIAQINPESLNPEKKIFVVTPKGMPDRWKELLQKQAFSWDLLTEVPKQILEKPPEPLPKDWKLQGTYMDQKRQPPIWAAVVSGDILKVGDKKGEFRVEEITRDEVIFSHSTGKQTLHFESGRTSIKQ